MNSLNGHRSSLEIACKQNIPYERVNSYIKLMFENNLITRNKKVHFRKKED